AQFRVSDFGVALAPAEHDARCEGGTCLSARSQSIQQDLRASSVIVRPQNVLEPRDSSDISAITARLFMQAAEEFRGVSQVLERDANLVAFVVRQQDELFAALHNASAQTLERSGGKLRYRRRKIRESLASSASPSAPGQKSLQLKREKRGLLCVDELARLGIQSLPALRERRVDPGEDRSIGERPTRPRSEQVAESIAFARGTESRRDALGLRAKRVKLGAWPQAVEHAEGGPHPPQRDAQLVDRLRIVALAQWRQ